MANPELEIVGLTGETVTKEPGTIDGDSITLKNLTDCTVYLLDYTSEVEVKNVKNCQIFIGPVDGPAIFENVSDSRIAVAAQQFQARAVQSTQFDLFSATQPTLRECAGVTIGCWRGAYAGLGQHFQKANLDPHSNHWDKARDISAEDGGIPAFRLTGEVAAWEAPLPGQPENPVPFSQPSADSGGEDLFSSATVSNGHAPELGGAPPAEHPKLAALQARLRERQEAQAAREQAVKTQLVQQAASFLEDFYQKRAATLQQRQKHNREVEAGVTVTAPEGNTEWEKAVGLINFGAQQRPGASDLSRFKSVLFAAKSKNVPVAPKAT